MTLYGANLADWAEEVAGVNSRSSAPSFTAALKLCQERAQDAEEQRRQALLDDVPVTCAAAVAASQLAKRRGQLEGRLSVNSPILEDVGEVGTSGSAVSSSRGEPVATTTTTGIGESVAGASASSNEQTTPYRGGYRGNGHGNTCRQN